MNKKEQLIQMIKFGIFSASAGIIQAGSFTIFKEIVKMEGYWTPYLISLILSIVWNFTLNRKFTFKSAANIPIAMAKVFGFYLVFTPVSTYLGDLAAVAGFNEYIILAVTMLSNLITEYLFCKYVVYRNQENTAKND